MWSTDQIGFLLVDDQSEDSVATVEVQTPDGMILIMGEPSVEGRKLVVRRVHMHGVRMGPNDVSAVNLRVIADAALEGFGYDEIVVEGGIRTSGANPGRRPRSLRFTRRAGHQAGSRST